MRCKGLILLGLTGFLTFCGLTSAHAELGGKVSSVEQDRLIMRARQAQEVRPGFKVHILSLDNGTVTKQYSNASGIVFAIGWDGPSRPNLRQLLGVYFARFQEDNRPERGRGRLNRNLKSTHIDFIVRNYGKNGIFWGYAYLPSELPEGFDLKQLTP